MYDQLKRYLDGFLVLSDSAAHEIKKSFKIQRFPKGKLVVSAGEKVDQAHFIIRGCCCNYSKKRDKLITHWFGFENSFVTDLYSFTTRKPSREYIQLVEDSVFLSISYHDLLRLYTVYHEWERLGRLIFEDFGRHTLNMINQFQTLSAKQRYAMLLRKEPRIVQRIPLGHISSYLGISQETLSRIRSQIR